MMNRLSKLKNRFNYQRQELWNDSETDISSISDNDNRKSSTIEILSNNSQTSNDDDDDSEISRENCCLICSILPNLSNINTCHRHLTLLTKPIQIIHMTHSKNNRHQSKFKHHYRSSSSSELRHYRKKSSMILESSDSSSQDDLFFSPNIQSQESITHNQQHRSIQIQTQLSPSLPPSSTIHKPLQQYNEVLLTPFLQQQNTNEIPLILKDIQNRSIQQKLSKINHKINSSDIIELDSNLSNSSNISLDQCTNDNNILNDINQKKITIDMNQLTEQILTDEYFQPRILLTRVCLEK
ncbi:unnamed protein product [Rotaria sp. Silwood1]|nr:unnamed protein product [Rotaria sp. Silwood1]CAF3662928.1 unnamed protein product [Rotaria sp. Silwood1]CAF4820073.1 unnamed protein product [Rotaria sp. Silwood1]CAF4867290.1 unnamed protein product [Rotaria sp. Silwood1]